MIKYLLALSDLGTSAQTWYNKQFNT